MKCVEAVQFEFENKMNRLFRFKTIRFLRVHVKIHMIYSKIRKLNGVFPGSAFVHFIFCWKFKVISTYGGIVAMHVANVVHTDIN